MKKFFIFFLLTFFTIPQIGLANFVATQEVGYTLDVSGDIQTTVEELHSSAPSKSHFSISQTVAYFVDVSGNLQSNTNTEENTPPPTSSGNSGSSGGGGSYYGDESSSSENNNKITEEPEITSENPPIEENTIQEEGTSKEAMPEELRGTFKENEKINISTNTDRTLKEKIEKEDMNTKKEQVITEIKKTREQTKQKLAKTKEIHTIQVEQIFYSQEEKQVAIQEDIESFHGASYNFPDYKKSNAPIYLFLTALFGLVVTTIKYSSYVQLKNAFPLHKINKRNP